MPRPAIKDAAAFALRWEPEPNTGCWLWLGTINEGGYGGLVFLGRKHKAHRVSWVLHRGDIPAGLSVLHRCDNPPCVNPSHLFLGTQSDNMRDMQRKGRTRGGIAPGEDHSRAKLRNADVATIQMRARAGELHRLIAAEFGVSRCRVSQLINSARTPSASPPADAQAPDRAAPEGAPMLKRSEVNLNQAALPREHDG